MSSKSKLIIGIVILALGAGLIPTGLLINDYLRNEVYDGVPRALRTIRDDGVEGLMPQIPLLSTPDVLKGIYDTTIDELEDFIVLRNTAAVLEQMKWIFVYDWYFPGAVWVEPSWGDMITYAAAARLMNQSLVAASNRTQFFNDDTFWTNIGGFWYTGVAGTAGYPLDSTFHTHNVVLDIGFDDAYLPNVPGWLTDIDMGSGIGNLLRHGYYVGNWSGDQGNDDYGFEVITGEYLCDNTTAWAIWNYVTDLYWMQVEWNGGWNAAYPGLSMADATNPNIGFYQQWANGTYINKGIDLFQFMAYNWVDFGEEGLTGLEAAIDEERVRTPTNISLAIATALWDEADNRSFLHTDGFEKWIGAATNSSIAADLIDYFNITSTQFIMVLNWLNHFMTDVTPVFIEHFFGGGIPLTELATGLFYEQWANGTIQGVTELPDGFLNELSPTLAGAPYFEIGLPDASNLTLAQTSALWSLTSDKTFFFSDSFNSIWYPALNNDSASQVIIMAEFGLDPGELAAVLGWLGGLIGLDPTTGRIAQIIEVEKGAPLATIVLFAVYEQWANGTINGEVAIPDGLLSRRSPPIYGPPYFELGLMYPVGLSLAQTMALWNEASEYSLVTGSGINKWYGAAPGKTIYDDLKTQNGLTDIQMGAILKWLPVFRDVIANKLGEDDKNLPMTPYALGETLVLSLGIGGGALAALGVVMLILSRRS